MKWSPPRSRWFAYGFAVLATVAAAGLRVPLKGVLGGSLPYVTFFAAIAASAAYGGRGPGLLATALGGLLSAWFLLAPAGSFRLAGSGEAIGLGLFALVGVGISLMFETLHAARRRLELQKEELRRVEAALRENDRRKDEFLATLAHELRNPLAPIRNSLALLRETDGRPADVAEARNIMDRQLGHHGAPHRRPARPVAITRGTLELRRRRVELASIIHQAIETVRPLVECARHELEVDLPPDPVHIDGDPMRLAQVFSNLLNNACKYTEPGGHIRLKAALDGSDIVVSVGDDGMGIPPDKLQTIFEMFAQVDRTLERSQSGLGIGLTIVKRIVEMHGGSIQVQSDGPGQGTTFHVRLPVLVGAPEKDPVPGVPEPARAAGRRILVVDDNRDSADSLAMLLRLGGNETHVAHDGSDALDAAGRLQPDLILLDLGLPRVNGYDVCQRIRREPWGRDVTIIALTGWGQQEDRRRSSEAGFDDHLVKPVDHDELMRLLAAGDGRSRSERTEAT